MSNLPSNIKKIGSVVANNVKTIITATPLNIKSGGWQGNRGPTSISCKYSVSLDGSNEYLTIPYSEGITDFDFDYNDQFSISCWMKTTSTVWGIFLGKMSSGIGRGWYLGLNQYGGGSGTVFFGLISTFGSNMLFFDEGSTVLNDGDWHHVCVTKSTSAAQSGTKIYIDGVADTLDGSYSGGDSLSATTTNTNPINIGARNNGGGFYAGKITEASIWNKELSSAEVTELYNSGTPTNLTAHSATSNLISWWRVGDNPDDSTVNGATIYDLKGVHNFTAGNTEIADLVEDAP